MSAQRGQALLYPERKRCLACRRYFGFLVVDGLYDSWECAGRHPLSSNPDDWPREHYVPERPWRPKREKHAWLTLTEAERVASKFNKEAYQCGFCCKYHIGSRNPSEGGDNDGE